MSVHGFQSDFSRAPLLVIWETTRSCALACRHCRAEAELGRRPDELSTAEGLALIDSIAGMGTPIVVLSGGDPLNRPDLDELVIHGKRRGLRVGTIPAATPSLTRERLARLQAAGLDQVALSLDGPTAQVHDGFRRVPGAFDKTLEAARWARELGLPLQLNTCFSQWNIGALEEMISLVASLGVVFWEVFFLVPVGRGRELGGLAPEQFEAFFERLSELERTASFIVKLTEGQHYRRFLARKARASPEPVHAGRRPGPAGAPRGISGGAHTTRVAVNAGKGFAFVDYKGDVCPSGFLPVAAGNVRRAGLAEIYRDSPVFRDLRDPAKLTGRCGGCEYRAVCSGSRARAWAVTGDMFAEDPACAYRA